MNIRSALAAVALIAFSTSALAFMPTKVTKEYIIGNQGQLSWNGLSDASCGCPTIGSNCYMKITVSAVVSDGGSYWHLEGSLDSCTAQITPTSSSPFTRELVHGGYTFPTGYLAISSGDFVGIPAMNIPLGGVTTSTSGTFTKDIPK